MTNINLDVGTELTPDEHTYTTIELFLFSAVGWHPHRIHYDQDYTRQVEGHEDLLVQGPLQAVHLFQYLSRRVPGVELRSVDYRHLTPLHVGVPAVLKGRVTALDDDHGGAEIEVWMEKAASGERTTAGHAGVRLPAERSRG